MGWFADVFCGELPGTDNSQRNPRSIAWGYMQDLHATLLAIRAGQTDARTEMAHAIAIAGSTACEHAFTRTLFETARTEAADAAPGQPLAGLAFSAKDLFDLAG